MRLLTYIFALLLSVSLFGHGGATPLDQLVRDVDAVVPAVAPQLIFDTPEAKKFSEFIQVDLETNRAEATIRLLRQHQDTKPSWQVAVEAVWGRYAGSAPISEDAALLESLFTATIKEGDHWLNYSSPRGWSDPYSFRKKLAKLILHARTGAPHDIENELLLRDNPYQWLNQLNAAPTQSAKQAATNITSTIPTPSVQPDAPKKAPEAKSTTTTPSQESASSTPWSIIVVLIATATGLLLLLLKRCL